MKTRKGFTLIELLVVISITSLLIGILLPSLQAGREKARRVVCQSNLRQINTAIWNYSVAEDGHVPVIRTPMTNGTAGASGVPGFGRSDVTDAQIDPFDSELWPEAMPTVLAPHGIGDQVKIFACPSAVVGWPRSGGAFRFSYRDAGINQPNGVDSVEGSYFRETFAFLDGRKLDVTPIHFTGNPIADAQLYPRAASTQVRDLVQRASNGWLTGAHDGGVNVITRNFEIEYRDQRRLNDDLGAVLTGAGGVRF